MMEVRIRPQPVPNDAWVTESDQEVLFSYETRQVDISNWIRSAVLMAVLTSKDEPKNAEYRTAE
jgi:hypothetical protein